MTTLLIRPDDKTVTITVQQRTLTAPQDAFRILTPIDLPTVFRPLFPFPGISGVKNQTEAWDHAGARRNPQFDDGSQADEELTEYTPGSSFAYKLTNFTNVLSRLAAGARGDCTPGSGRKGPRPGHKARSEPYRQTSQAVRRGLAPSEMCHRPDTGQTPNVHRR